MDLWQLRTFRVLAKTLHFTRAAEELNLSQPAVSHQIKALEREVGEILFLRDKDGVLLTKAGQTMFEHAIKILDVADEMRLEISGNKEALSGKVILGAATRGLSNSFPLIYREFKKIHKDIEIVFQLENRLDELVGKVRSGAIDIGMISHDLDFTGLVLMPYGEYELLLTVGRNHRFAKMKEISLEDLRNEEWVLFETGSLLRKTIEDNLAKDGIIPKIGYETNDGSLVVSMIAHDNRISFLPEWGVLNDLENGNLIAVKIKDVKYKVQVNLIWKESRRTKLMSAVISHLIEEKPQGITPLAES